MKRCRRIMAALLALLMLSTMLYAGAAGDKVQIRLSGPETCAPGDTIQIKVELAENPGIANLVVDLSFDDSVLKLTKVEDAGMVGESLHSDRYTPPYRMTWADDLASSNITYTGTLATLTFEVSKDAKAGDTQFKPACGDVFDVNLEDVPAQAAWFTMTVQGTDAGTGSGSASPEEPAAPTQPEEPAAPTEPTQPASTDSGVSAGNFTDLDPAQWYYSGVDYALKAGLMKGVSDTQFSPGGVTTRAMLVTILYRLVGSPAAATASGFQDVAAGSWYADAVNWAAEKGIVKGISETQFAPDQSVTREQMATILYRYIQTQGKGFQGLWAFQLDGVDAGDVSDFAYEAMCWMTMNKIINGTDGNRLAPKATATRAEIATILMRFVENVE